MGKDGKIKKTKRPYGPETGKLASSTNPKTWATRVQAEAWSEKNGGDGVGFVFGRLGKGANPGHGEILSAGIDLDTCRNPETGAFTGWAQEVIDRFKTNTEVSPSGTGAKLFFIIVEKDFAALDALFDGQSGREFKRDDGSEHLPGIEVYWTRRYFTVTGKSINPEWKSRPVDIADLQWLIREAGPKYIGNSGNGSAASEAFPEHPAKTHDNSRSGKAWRAGAALYGASYEVMRDALLTHEDPDIAAWTQEKGLARVAGKDERELHRIYDKADATGAFAASDKAPIIEPKAGVDFSRRRRTDAGNARAFLDLFGDDLRFIEKWKCWIAWDGARWTEASDIALLPMAVRTTEEIWKWTLTQPESDERKAWRKHVAATQSDGRLSAMIRQAKGPQQTRIEPDILDADPWLLGCPNGTLDLRTGKLREARREDFITKQISVAFDPAAECPRWRQFLDWATQGDGELAAFIQTFAGYALTGETNEEIMCVWFGDGANGKTTLGMMLYDLLGDYAGKARSDLLVHAQGKEGAASPDAAALQGKQFVIVSETEHNCSLSETQIKELTSNEPITACKKYCEPSTFRPTHKFILWTNHPPHVRGTDHGIWRRLAITRFGATITEEAKITNFREKMLQPELPGILNWVLEGLARWRRDGLRLPRSVRAANKEYREEMDTVAEWIEEKTKANPASVISIKRLHSDYTFYLNPNGSARPAVWPLGRRQFTNQLEAKGYPMAKTKEGERGRKGGKMQPPGWL